MQILITGGTGFVGYYLIKELINSKHNITVISNKKSDLKFDSSNLKFIYTDLYDISINFPKLYGIPDILIHLAWGGLPNYKSNFHFETELPNQYIFLSKYIKAGLKNLFITGTCFEYGIQNGMLSETLITKPNNPYGFAKDTLRIQLEYLQNDYFFNLIWGRLFYMYGDFQSSNSIYSLLKNAISQNNSEFPMSGGEQLRDYLKIEEVAKLILNLSFKMSNLGIVNICSGIPISMRKLVENWIIENNWNIKIKLGVYPYPDYEPFAFWGDTKKLKSILSK